MGNNSRGKISITPGGKLAWSLKYSSHNAQTSIGELVDNSFDLQVGGTKVLIFKREKEIVIVDNGSGMNRQTLEDALKPGSSESVKDVKRLGIFGVGLNLGASHLGNRFTILTKKGNGKPLAGIYDIDVMDREGFVAEAGEMNLKEVELFDYYMSCVNSPTGTVIIIDKLEQEYQGDNVAFANSLAKFLGETFRRKLAKRKSITIFAEEHGREKTIEVAALDPMTMQRRPGASKKVDIPEPKIIGPMKQDFIDKKTGKKFEVTVVFSYLPLIPPGTDLDLMYNISETNQGIYYMRNERQISRAKPWLTTSKHNQLNRLRCEVYFDGNGDNAFGTNSEKNRVLLPEWFKEKLNGLIGPIVTNIRQVAREEAMVSVENDPEFIKMLKRISSSISKEFQRKKGRVGPRPIPAQKATDKPGKPGQKRQFFGRTYNVTETVPLNIEFTTCGQGEAGSRVYVVDKDVQSSLIIRLNQGHSFYSFIHANPDAMAYFLKIIAAEAWAEREVSAEMAGMPDLEVRSIIDRYNQFVGGKIDNLFKEVVE